MQVRTGFILIGSFLLSPFTWAYAVGDGELSLWTIKYSAPTLFEDGYTVEGKAKAFTGRFLFKDGILKSLEGQVPVKSLSSGLEARDESIRDLLFKAEDGQLPDVRFEVKDVPCEQEGEFWRCAATGKLSVQGEWQTVSTDIYISTYQGRPWLHAEGTIQLSNYAFYAKGSKALKVADRVDLSIDLLGQN